MNYLKEILNNYLPTLLHSFLVGIISYLGIETKKIIQKHLNQRMIKEVTEKVYFGVNELYPNLSEEDKQKLMLNNTLQILKEKGIQMNNLELLMYLAAHKNIEERK